MPVTSSLKTYGKIKTYGPKNNLRKLNDIPASEASLVFDALLSKNISKRNESLNESLTKKPNTRQKQHIVKELPSGKSVFNDSLDVRINTTFDDLFVGPAFNKVEYTDKISRLFSDSSLEKSKSLTRNKLENKNEQENTPKKKYVTRNRNKVETKSKVQKKKRTAKKKIVESLISTIDNSKIKSDQKNSTPLRKSNRIKSNEIKNALSQPVECSLIIENINGLRHQNSIELSKLLREESYKRNVSNLSIVKLTKPSTSQLTNYSNLRPENDYEYMFNNSFQHLMQAESTPKYIKSSTPIIPKISQIKLYNSKLENVSPITQKSNLNLYNSLSLFSDINSKIQFNNTRPEIQSLKSLSTSGFKKELYRELFPNQPKMTRSKTKLLSNSIVSVNDSEVIHKSDLKLKNLPVVLVTKMEDKSNTRHTKTNSNQIQKSNQNNSIHETKKYYTRTSKMDKNKILLSQSSICRSTRKNEGSIQIIENSISSTSLINLNKKKRRKQNDSKSIEVNLVEWESFTRRHSFILCADSEPDSDVEIVSIEKLPQTSNSFSDIEIVHIEQLPEEEMKILRNTRKNNSKKERSKLNRSKKNSEIIIERRITRNSKNKRITQDDKENISVTKLNNSRKNNSHKELNNSQKTENVPILNDSNEGLVLLSPGKSYRRSLSILKQNKKSDAHFPSPEETKFKGRKWRTTVFSTFAEQDKYTAVSPKRSILTNNGVHKFESYRPSIRIVQLSRKSKRPTAYYKKSGYVSTLTNDTVLESFTKLSLELDEEREKTAKEIILKRCNQTEPLLFNECYSERTLKKCRKIGEGVYGEVFMYKNAENKCVVMKIIPIEGEQLVNGEHQKKFEEIISEIIISTELSNLRKNKNFKTDGFAEVIQVCMVQGKYPQHLIDLWDLYDEDRGSENDSPLLFHEEQLYIVLELANGGQDLEAYHFNNAEQSYSLFAQIACTMAVAEAALEFEHRDLHWGNVLISPTDETTITYRIKGREFEVPTKGVKLTIIDFTLSRMTSNDFMCIFNDLAMDPDLFTATGDYQFEIYRLMRKRNSDDWQKFEPYTNILWMDYTLDKMINALRYIRTNSKTHKTHIRKLSQIKKKILSSNSVMDFINSDVFSNVFL